MSNQTELYLAPKHLSNALKAEHGVTVSADYIRAIRTECERNNNGLFVAGDARASDLLKWMKRHPNFRRRLVRKKKETGAV